MWGDDSNVYAVRESSNTSERWGCVVCSQVVACWLLGWIAHGYRSGVCWLHCGSPACFTHCLPCLVYCRTPAVKIHRNFKEALTIRTGFAAEAIHGGQLLGVRAQDFIVFYDWATGKVGRGC